MDICREHSVMSVADLPPTPQQRRLVLIIAVAQLVAFGVVAPMGDIPLLPVPAFIPSVQAIIFVNDLITSVLLFAQYSITRSAALLTLASGYLFTALIVIPQALTFPGAFTADGLLGAGPQSSTWLYIFWHIGSPAAMAVYGCIKDRDRPNGKEYGSAATAIGWCVVLVCIVVCALTWVATAGKQFLPSVFTPDRIHMIPIRAAIASAAELLATVLAVAVLWMRRRSVLDYWLLLVLGGMMPDKILPIFLFTTSRYTVGYYAGRTFLLMTSVFVLVQLLAETTRLYAGLARANLRLQRERDNKLMSVQAIMASISHEVRQPLAAITSNASAALRWLGRTPPDHDEVRASLNRIVSDGHRTGEVFDGIRTLFGRANQGQQQVDMNEIILDVLNSLRGELDDHRVATRPDLTFERPLVVGYRGQLRQVIFNLAHNAIEAMATTTNRKRELSVRTELRGHDEIVVSVQDSGPGIDPGRLDGIFGAFVTTKAHGTGLGLAICRMIIEHHGGQLSALSDGKGGALFQFVLPIASAKETAVHTA
jgi:signal transduction histidine kinase